MLSRKFLGLVSGAILALVGCDHEHGDDHTHGGDAHSHDGGDAFDHTKCTGMEQTYSEGLEQTGEGGLLKLKLITAEPTPLQVGKNTLTIQVMDAQGNVLDDATFADTTNTWQHVHGHAGASNGVATATPTGEPGTFAVSDMTVIHPGSWEFRFDITAGGVTDRVVYHFCVAEGQGGTDGHDSHGTDGHDSHGTDGTDGTDGTEGETDGTEGETDGTDGHDSHGTDGTNGHATDGSDHA